MKHTDLRGIIETALMDLETDRQLLRTDADEKCLSQRFAEHLDTRLWSHPRRGELGYSLHCPYRGHVIPAKALPERFQTLRTEECILHPGIVIHMDGPRGVHLLAIEVITTTSARQPGAVEYAKWKLEYLKFDFRYHYSLCVCFRADPECQLPANSDRALPCSAEVELLQSEWSQL
jgi:hypothetical protein